MVTGVLLVLVLRSLSFAPGSMLPGWAAHGGSSCPGGNRSPELHWSPVPPHTRSLAIIAFDPDARGGWYHWIVYNLPPSLHRLPVAAVLPADELGVTSFGKRTYGGPCPPPGRAHHYAFTLYALDTRMQHTSAALNGTALLARMRGHVLASARLVGRYGIR